MSAEDAFEERLERIKEIADVVGKFENPVLQEAAYHYLVGDGSSAPGALALPPPKRPLVIPRPA